MLFADLLGLLFPEYCIGCGKPGTILCAICERTITTKPVALSGTSAALFDYQHPLVKKTIWALKYHRKRAVAKYFGTALYREFFKGLAHGERHKHEAIVLIPIPGGKKAVAMRGYNHAALIAEAIRKCGKADGLNITSLNNVLYKRREIPNQVKAREKTKREKNVEGIFRIRDAEKLLGKTVILIDDVITTGATIGEAKRVIKGCQPKRVLALAVAH